jgi:hypothetical protein
MRPCYGRSSSVTCDSHPRRCASETAPAQYSLTPSLASAAASMSSCSNSCDSVPSSFVGVEIDIRRRGRAASREGTHGECQGQTPQADALAVCSLVRTQSAGSATWGHSRMAGHTRSLRNRMWNVALQPWPRYTNVVLWHWPTIPDGRYHSRQSLFGARAFFRHHTRPVCRSIASYGRCGFPSSTAAPRCRARWHRHRQAASEWLALAHQPTPERLGEARH